MIQRKHKQVSWSLICLLGCLVSFASFAQNKIQSVRIWPSPGSTRVVFDLKSAPDYSYFTLSKPNRLVIDLGGTDDSIDLQKLTNDSELIKRIRYSNPKDKNSTRVVIELNAKASTNVFSLPPTPPYSNRLVVDFATDETAPQQVVQQKDDEEREIIIALDAGHGGEDPGSIGSAGTYEKDITLSIVRKLEAMINAEPGMKAILTRKGDYYVSLNKRPEIARQAKADLLVSVHADAFTTPQPHGASVWVLSMRRANSELGRWMEKSEKHSELLGGAAEVIEDTASERYLTQALLDMSMDHSMTTSYTVGREVIRGLKSVTSLHKNTPQAASLAVLTSPDIPSILVETGFISNPKEEKNLNWETFRQRIATSIFSAVKSHFQNVPPDGTLWAKQRKTNRTHKVRSGESLSLLAQRYNVDVSQIKAANNLNGDMVRIGQVLTIPSS